MSTPATRRVLVLAVSALTCGCGESNRTGSSPTIPSGPPAAPPVVAAVSPDHGPTWRYTAVDVRGSGFQRGATVMFDGATSFGRFVDSGRMEVRTPMRPVGMLDVMVTNPDGQRAALAAAYTFEAVPRPTLTPSANTVIPGAQLSISWQTSAPGTLDWIALFSVATATNDEHASFWWDYTDGSASGILKLTAPPQPGQYEFRYLPDDQYTAVTRSSVVTVSGAGSQ